MGGGHNDYGGNEVYRYDFEALQWTRVADPAPLTQLESDGLHYVPESGPISPHTYDGLVWNPVTDSLWLTATGIGFGGGGTPYNPDQKAVWEFDPETGQWTAHDATLNASFGTSGVWTGSGEVVAIAHLSSTSRRVFTYDADGTEQDLGRLQGALGWQGDSSIGNMFQNPETGQLYEAHASGIYKITVTNNQATSEKVADFPTHSELGFSTNYKQASYAYNPTDQSFYIWNGSREVVRWDPADQSFEVFWNEGDPTAPDDSSPGTGRVFDKWIYLEDADVFAGLKDTEDGGIWLWKPEDNPPDAAQLQIGTATLDPATAHSLAVLMPALSGDRDFDASVTVTYRELGQSQWQDGLDLMRLRPEFVQISRDFEESGEGFAGSLFGLKAGTTYEIKLQATDPDGVRGPASQVLTATTAEIPTDDPRDAAPVSVSTMAQLQSAIKGADPGDVIVVAPGEYQGTLTITNSGTAERPIVIRGLDRSTTILDAEQSSAAIRIAGDYVHVEDLTIRNADIGIAVRGDTDGVAIRRNLITEVSKGIDAREGHRDLYITDNILRGKVKFPDTSNTTWDYEGIVVTGQGIEVAYNTLSGFGDSLGLSATSDIANIGIDIHHNEVLWGGDDGIELDFALRNVQAHHNLIANTANGISAQPVWGGPAYAYKNVIYNTERGPYKIKPEQDNPSGLYLLNNTSIKSGEAWVNFSGDNRNIMILNNLFVNESGQTYALVNESRHNIVEMDYNAWSHDGQFRFYTEETRFDVNSFAEWQSQTPFDDNGVLLSGERVFATLDPGLERNGFPVLRDLEDADFSLDPGSSAVDAGKRLAGINDDFAGPAPDIGAWERGRPAPEYGARIDVAPATQPQALADFAMTKAGQAITIEVLANDFDPNNDALTVTNVEAAAHGTVTRNADGTLTYTPNAAFTGEDSFRYTVSDGNGGTDTTTVVVAVGASNQAPVAQDDSVEVPAGGVLAISVDTLLTNDSDPDGDAMDIITVGAPGHGVAVLEDGTITYTADAEYHGADAFTYTVSDGRGGTDTATVTAEIMADVSEPEKKAPTAVDDLATGEEDKAVVLDVLDNDSEVAGSGLTLGDAAHGTLSINGDRTVTYTPDADFHGTDRFTYTISNQAGSSTGTVSLTVTPRNDAPSAQDDAAKTEAGQAMTVDVLANDRDVDGDTLSVVAVAGAEHGTVRVNADDTLTYRPEAGFEGTETFTYTAADGRGGTDTARVAVTVENSDDGAVVLEGGAAADTLDARDADGPRTIIGKGGDDIITGGPSDDLIAGGPGGDRIDGGNGLDTADYADSPSGIVVDFSGRLLGTAGAVSDGYGSFDSLRAVEGVSGSKGDDLIFGDDGDETFVGRGGNDVLDGRSGRDRLTGNEGDDTILGGGGDDILEGGSGNDRLDGGDGDDVLLDGVGTDWLKGGPGIDRIVLTPFDSAVDTIASFSGANGEGDLVDLRDFGASPAVVFDPATGLLSVNDEDAAQVLGDFDPGTDLLLA